VRLPELTGSPISIYAQPRLTAHRGELLSRSGERGTPVHAGSFIRKREIVLERELLFKPRTLRLILVHEIFHFVWSRLRNGGRREFEGLLASERKHRARGELGESSAVKKSRLPWKGSAFDSPRQWRDYVCESFCDTAAWLYAGVKDDRVFTLAKRWRAARKSWFDAAFAGCSKC